MYVSVIYMYDIIGAQKIMMDILFPFHKIHLKYRPFSEFTERKPKLSPTGFPGEFGSIKTESNSSFSLLSETTIKGQ